MSAEIGIRAKRIAKREGSRAAERPIAQDRFHWIVALLCSWFVLGAYLDAWAHNNLAQPETFFTPWHAVLYSGAGAVMVFVAATQLRNTLKGHSIWRSLPDGYGLTLVGLIGFALGGLGDMLWHTAYAIGLTAMRREFRFIPGTILTGLIADVLNHWLQPSTGRHAMMQVFAFCVPFVFHLFYFAALSLTSGTWWTIHMWLGMTFISGIVGVALTMLLLLGWQPADESG